ncbi:MAG TPA: prepilin-type N-terminal cleavage/methylation domain-containing protein [Candidatus Limnocylindria bacterium]|nr:prepilin-type N-terminal cleavage/methylation domain-containing protein [Candidatus Limnocylindria bacterium]
MRDSERGFSLIEILLATALFVVVSFGALAALRQLSASEQHLAARHLAYESLERLTAQWRAEARSATAIWVSSPSAGTARDGCVQVEFATADAGGPHFWSYRSFPNHAAGDAIPGDALERLTGSAPIAPCDAAQTGTVATDTVRTFAAVRVAAASLPAHVDPVLGAGNPDSPFAGSAVSDGAVGIGFTDANGMQVSGGNAIVEVTIANDDAARVVDLTPGVFPTGYTLALTYTCDDRCTVGHTADAPQTVTACALTGWQLSWSVPAAYKDVPRNDGSGIVDVVPSAWWVAGYFVFTYSGTAPDGTTDQVTHAILATNVGQTPADGSHGTAATFAARSSPPPSMTGDAVAAWYSDFVPFVDDAGPYDQADVPRTTWPDQEKGRCDRVSAKGQNGDYSYD